MTDHARIRWDGVRRAFLAPDDHVIAEYDPYSSMQANLDELEDVTTAELYDVLCEAVGRNDVTATPTIAIDYLPSAVGVYRSAWAANYPYPADMLCMTRKANRLEFSIDIVLPRKSELTDQIIRALTEPILSACRMTAVETTFYNDSSDGGLCDMTVVPPPDATVRQMALMVSHLRDIVMNEPFSANPEKSFAAIKSGEIQFLLSTAESETLDAKDGHYSKHDRARIVMAADVAAFANSAKGGIIVLGARTVKDLHGRDILAEVNGCTIDIGARDRYRSAIEALVYPDIAGIRMCRMPAPLGEVFAILIPAQDPDRLPFIVRGATQGEGRVSSALFQVPVRQGDSNIPARIEDIHRRLSTFGERDR